MLDEEFEDYDDVAHVAKAQKLGRSESETAKSPKFFSQSKKIADENYDRTIWFDGKPQCKNVQVGEKVDGAA